MQNQKAAGQLKEVTIARFGQAALVRTKDGRFVLRGGSKSDHIEARDWASMFFHEASLRNG